MPDLTGPSPAEDHYDELLPVFLKSEYHEIRATLEAYAKAATVEGKDRAEARGIGMQSGVSTPLELRVTMKGGVRVVYKLDRWD